MAGKKVMINRAPVMTLWAAVVAERLGFDRDEALTLGKGVAGLNAQSKGQRLGIYEPGEEKAEERGKKARERKRDEVFSVDILGRPVPVVNADGGVRALSKDQPIDPRSVERYLEKKFGEDLAETRSAMEELAKALELEALERRAYDLYEKFRPKIPEGTKGWGAAGELDLELIRSLGK